MDSIRTMPPVFRNRITGRCAKTRADCVWPMFPSGLQVMQRMAIDPFLMRFAKRAQYLLK
jgi:hypothetical protein